MSVSKPTHAGLWWFKGTHGKMRGGELRWASPLEGPVEYDGGDSYPIQIMACDEIFELEDFVGFWWPLNHDVVVKGNADCPTNCRGK